MHVEIVPYHFDNYAYILVCPKTKEAAIVDTGEYYPIARVVEKLGVKLTTILCTHHHYDHTEGLEEFCAEHPEITVVGYKDERRIAKINAPVDDGASVQVGELQGRVIYTPGHTRGSVCYHFDDVLFTGDTIFGAGCGRLFEGTPEQMYASLQTLIRATVPETKVYVAHEYTIEDLNFARTVEPDNADITARLQQAEITRKNGGFTVPSTMGLELATNPFLRSDSANIQKTLTEQGLLKNTDPVTVFTVVRQLRDNF